MGLGIFQVTVEGHIGPEAIANVFHFISLATPHTDATDTDLLTVADAVKAAYSASYNAAMVSDYVCEGWRCSGWNTLGNQVTALPVFVADGASGSASPTRDGNAHAANAKCTLGALVSLVLGSSTLRRGYFALGPLTSDCVSSDGELATGGMSAWGTFRNLLDNILDCFATTDLVPVKVSHTAEHALSHSVTSYRPITSLSWGNQTLLRKSRNNFR